MMMLTHDGVTQSVNEWALDYGIPAELIRTRLRRGWPVDRAITETMPFVPGAKLADDCPAKGRAFGANKVLEHGGLALTLEQWAERQGMTYAALAFRLRNGWPIHQALTTPPRRSPSKRRPGVVSNFATFAGTGGGSTAEERPEITFSEKH
jgi:hypothetical protein